MAIVQVPDSKWIWLDVLHVFRFEYVLKTCNSCYKSHSEYGWF